MNPVLFSEVFDFSNTADVEKALKLIESMPKVYNKAISSILKKLKELQKAEVENIKTAELLKAALENDANSIENLSSKITSLSTSHDKLTKDIDSTKTAYNKLNKEKGAVVKKAKDVNNIHKEAIKLEAKLGSLSGERAKEAAVLKLQIQEKNKELKEEARETLGLITLYEKESKRLIELRKRYKDVALAKGIMSSEARKLEKELSALDNELKSVDASAGQFQRSVGNYPKLVSIATKSFGQLASALGFSGVIFGLVSAFKEAYSVIKDFQAQNAVLASVLGTTREGVSKLTEEAERLGSITAKSSTEVTELQIAYARLGFTQSEIIDLTGDTINGSIALNSELSETADLTGAVIRTFDDLSTTDAGDVLDSLTLSTQKSALNFEKLQTALPIVAGAANAAGISFTRTVSLLGKLSDAGIDASSSATSLRNIFIDSKKKGLDYNQVLDKISKSQDLLTAANDKFGKRSAVAASILANLSDEVENLDEKLRNAGGTIEKVAATQLDTLNGKTQLLTSAWEGFILRVDNGNGSINRFFSAAITGTTKLLNSLASSDSTIADNIIGDLDLQSIEQFQDLVEDGVFDPTTKSIDKLIEKKLEDKRVSELQQDSYEIYDIALKQGVTTIEEFLSVKDEFINQYQREEDIITQETQIVALYNEVLEKNINKKKELSDVTVGLTSDQIFAIEQYQNLVDLTRDFSEELSPEEMKKLKDATLEWGEELGKAGKKTDDLKPLKVALETEIPESIDKVESKTKSFGEKFGDWFKVAGEEIKVAVETAFQVATIAVDSFFENQSIKRENELAEYETEQEEKIEILEERRDTELANENLTDDAKTAISESYNNKIQALEEETDAKRVEIQKNKPRRLKIKLYLRRLFLRPRRL